MFLFEKKEGLFRVKSVDCPMFAGWLESDIQTDLLQIKKVSNKASKILAEKFEPWQMIGNLFEVNVSSKFVTVEYNDKEYLDEVDLVVDKMELEKFIVLLDAWRGFIQSKSREFEELDL